MDMMNPGPTIDMTDEEKASLIRACGWVPVFAMSVGCPGVDVTHPLKAGNVVLVVPVNDEAEADSAYHDQYLWAFMKEAPLVLCFRTEVAKQRFQILVEQDRLRAGAATVN